MKRQERYLTLDSEGNESYEPMTRRPRRSASEFFGDFLFWFRISFFLFCAFVILFTAYYFGPFPPLSLFGFVLHP